MTRLPRIRLRRQASVSPFQALARLKSGQSTSLEPWSLRTTCVSSPSSPSIRMGLALRSCITRQSHVQCPFRLSHWRLRVCPVSLMRLSRPALLLPYRSHSPMKRPTEHGRPSSRMCEEGRALGRASESYCHGVLAVDPRSACKLLSYSEASLGGQSLPQVHDVTDHWFSYPLCRWQCLVNPLTSF
jgi:hypothetical protein